MENSLFADKSQFEFRNTAWLHLLSGVVLFAWVGVIALFIRETYGPVPLFLYYGVAVFSFIGMYYLVRAFDQRVQVRIDKNGISDRRNGIGVIPWQEVAELRLGRSRSQWLMSVRVVHPEFVVERAAPIDKWVSRVFNRKPDQVKVPLEDAHVTEELRRFIYSVANTSDMSVRLAT